MMACNFHVTYLVLVICVTAYPAASCPSIVSRQSWGATSTRLSNLSVNPPAMVFIHHTTGSGCSSQSTCSSKVKGIQRDHMTNRGWSDIGYSFLIGGDGSVYEGRGWGKTGAHTKGFNSQSIAISFIGDYSNSSPSWAMQNAAKSLIECGVRLGKISSSYRLYGHRQAGNTACPGNTLYSIIKSWKNWSPEYLYSTSRCTAIRGKCQEDNTRCSGRYVSGKCPGASNIRCCTP